MSNQGTVSQPLAVIAIIGMLAGMLIPAYDNAVKSIHHATDVFKAKSMATVLAIASQDNEGNYPDGENSTAIFRALKQGGYLQNEDDFIIRSKGKAQAAYSLTGGITTDSSDGVPILYSSGNQITGYYPNATLVLGKDNEWKKDGVTVVYKDQHAVFLKANSLGEVPGFIGPSYTDTNTYQQRDP